MENLQDNIKSLRRLMTKKRKVKGKFADRSQQKSILS